MAKQKKGEAEITNISEAAKVHRLELYEVERKHLLQVLLQADATSVDETMLRTSIIQTLRGNDGIKDVTITFTDPGTLDKDELEEFVKSGKIYAYDGFRFGLPESERAHLVDTLEKLFGGELMRTIETVDRMTGHRVQKSPIRFDGSLAEILYPAYRKLKK